MNVVGIVFHECYHLLCRFHIQKNVQAKCKMLVNSVDAWDVVLQAWENVMAVKMSLSLMIVLIIFSLFPSHGLYSLNMLMTRGSFLTRNTL